MATCEIKWINKQGNKTPDTNPAIQICRLKDHIYNDNGRKIHLAASQWWYICAEHSKRLLEPGMERWETASIINPDDASLDAMLKRIGEINAK